MGNCYEEGKGVVEDSVEDSVEAVKWFRKSAEQGDPEALKILGESYNYGLNLVDKDETPPSALPAQSPESELKLNLEGVNYDFGLKKPKRSISVIFGAFWKTSLIIISIFLVIIILGFIVAIIGAVIDASSQNTSKEIVRQNPPQFTPTPEPTPTPSTMNSNMLEDNPSKASYKDITFPKGTSLDIREYPSMKAKIKTTLVSGRYHFCISSKNEVFTDSDNLKWRFILVEQYQGWVLEYSLENP